MNKFSNHIIEVHETKPLDFKPLVHVAACYLEVDGKLLLLLRAPGSFEELTWGVPAGKMEGEETPLEGACRELFEETGIQITSPDHMLSLGALYIRKATVDYVYHLFKLHLDHIPNVRLSHEHTDYVWADPAHIHTLKLISGGIESLKLVQQRFKKLRSNTNVNAYLILKKDNKALLSLRKNTSYGDGRFGLIAGHVEYGESATAAIVREASEEIGIRINPSNLKVAHVLHRQTNRLNVDIFFECTTWSGQIINYEPEKCECLQFFPIDALPANTLDYILEVFKNISMGRFYSESGWQS